MKDIINTIPLQKWEDYFSKLLTEDRKSFKEQEHENKDIKTQGSPVRITENEVRKQVHFLKNGRAPGPGDIYGELIKHGGDKLYKHLTKLFQTCVNKQDIPEE